MYQYNLQFKQVPPPVYAGFYNETPFYIGLTTNDPSLDGFKVNFFAQDSNSSPFQVPQNKWSHLVPQWGFKNSNGEYIEWDVPIISENLGVSSLSAFSVSAYYVDDLPATVTLIATLDTINFPLSSDHQEAMLPSYSNSLIFDTVDYDVLSGDIDSVRVTQDGKNEIDTFKWTDTVIPFVVTLHPPQSLESNVYGLTGYSPILFSTPVENDEPVQISLTVNSVPQSSVLWNDTSSVYMSAFDEYGFRSGGYYRGYFTPSVSSVPASIGANLTSPSDEVIVEAWNYDGNPLPGLDGFPQVSSVYENWTLDNNDYDYLYIITQAFGFSLKQRIYIYSDEEAAWGINVPSTYMVASATVSVYTIPTTVPLVEVNSSGISGSVNAYANFGFQVGRAQIRKLTWGEVSNEFQIKKLERPYEIRRFNESWDTGDVIHSFALAEHTYLNPVFFDNFMEVSVGGLESSYQSIGRNMFERIANFVKNHSDIDTSNVDQFYSILDQMDVPYDDYKLSYPSELERLVDIISIHKTKLLGSFCKCTRNFFNEASECDFCGHVHPLNRSEIPNTSDTFVVSAGVPFVVENIYSKNPIYKFDIVFPSTQDLNGPSSAIIDTLPSVSWMTSSVYYKYSFYDYTSAFCGVQEEGVINWNDNFTTLSSSISSLEQWYGDEALVEEMLNYEIHRGLYNA